MNKPHIKQAYIERDYVTDNRLLIDKINIHGVESILNKQQIIIYASYAKKHRTEVLLMHTNSVNGIEHRTH